MLSYSFNNRKIEMQFIDKSTLFMKITGCTSQIKIFMQNNDKNRRFPNLETSNFISC